VQEAPKVQAQSGRRAEATVHGNALYGFIGGLQEALRQSDALMEEPVIRAGAERGTEAAGSSRRSATVASIGLFLSKNTTFCGLWA
jgi:hypothetical protein